MILCRHESLRQIILSTAIMATIQFNKLSSSNLDFLSIYLENQVSKAEKQKKKDVIQITKHITGKTEISAEQWHILNLAHCYLLDAGLQGDISNSFIEIWRYRLFGERISSPLAKHRDNYGLLFGPVNTVIFYLRKDKTVKGGNLEVYRAVLALEPIATYDCSAGNVLVFEGSVVHKVEPLLGTGIRDCIVVQMRCQLRW